MSDIGAVLQAGGTVGMSAIYIRRPQDDDVFESLFSKQYCNILTTRQMGKSSMMARLRTRLAEKGVRSIAIDMAGDIGTPKDAETFYTGILDQITLGLDIDDDVGEWWEASPHNTANQRFVRFFRDIVLQRVKEPVVVFLDEIDATLKLPFADDLFTAIRTLHNDRVEHRETERLTFCLLGTVAPAELVKDHRTTPYNVGRTVELVDFDPSLHDLSLLEDALTTPRRAGRERLETILRWTDGHPFLTMTMCRRVVESKVVEVDVDDLVEAAISEPVAEELRTHFSWILQFLATRLRDGDQTFTTLGTLLRGGRLRPRETSVHTELRLSGLVKVGRDGFLTVRNAIYRKTFDLAWLNKTRPPRPTRTPKWVPRVVAGGGLLIVAFAALLIIMQQRSDLQDQRDLQRINSAIDALEGIQGERKADDAFDDAVLLVGGVHDEDARKTLTARLKEKYASFWAGEANAFNKRALAENNVEQAIVLAAAGAVKRGAAQSAPPFDDLMWRRYQADPLEKYVLATLRLDQMPRRVRWGDDAIIAAISDPGTLWQWNIHGDRAPAFVRLSGSHALAANGGLLAVSSGKTVDLWSIVAHDGGVGGPRRLGSVQVGCDVVRGLALTDGDKPVPRVGAGCDDGRALVERVTFDSDAGAPAASVEAILVHGSESRSAYSSVYALAFGPLPDGVVTASRFLWGRAWNVATRTSVAIGEGDREAVDVRLAGGRMLILTGQLLQAHSPTLAELYERSDAGWQLSGSMPPIPNAHVAASDVDAQGRVASVAFAEGGAGGHIRVWHAGHASVTATAVGVIDLDIATTGVAPKDVAWLPDGKLAVAMTDQTIRILSLSEISVPREPKEAWKSWQTRLGLTLREDKVRWLWPLDGTTGGFVTLAGPKTTN